MRPIEEIAPNALMPSAIEVIKSRETAPSTASHAHPYQPPITDATPVFIAIGLVVALVLYFMAKLGIRAAVRAKAWIWAEHQAALRSRVAASAWLAGVIATGVVVGGLVLGWLR